MIASISKIIIICDSLKKLRLIVNFMTVDVKRYNSSQNTYSVILYRNLMKFGIIRLLD